MLKRFCAIILTLVLLAGFIFTDSFVVEAASGAIVQSGDWKYIVSADGTAILRKYCGTDEIVQVPSEIDNFRVTKLVDTFYENSYVTNVTIPEGVTSIESYAFYGCNRLHHISIPETVSTIGHDAFYKCVSLESIVIPTGVTSIGDNAFYGCYSLTNVNLPEGLTSIGHYAFIGCKSLQDVIVPESVTSIGQGAFQNCSSLVKVSLPNNITNIVRYLFVGCTNLVDIIIPNNVTSIGMAAFDGCSSLTEITIPEKATDIDDSAFAGCNNLKSVHISDLKQWCQINFGNTTSNPLSRGAGLFLNGNKLEEIVMPEGLSSVGNNVFTGYEDLKSVTIPDGVVSIGENAFSLCTNLTSITIPDGATSIGNYAFGGCRRLQSVSIPGSIISIGRNAFANCINLKSIVIPEGVKRIEEETFYACKSLRSVSISEGLTSIGEYAFISCNSLESISIPNSVTSMEYGAFAGCSSLIEITIPTNLTCIEGCVFSTCSSLTDVTIPKQITSIGWHAFYACTNLTRIYIPNEVAYIDNYAFTDCEQLTIYGIADSCAQNYASINGIPFVLDPLIQYDANGGTDAPPAVQPQRGEKFKLSTKIPVRLGYKFLGWSTERNGAVEYYAGGNYENADNVILYAVWEKAYVVTYDANGGTNVPNSQTKYPGETLRLANTIPTRDNYSFKGWSTESDGEVIYMPSSNYEIDGDITLYAVWDWCYRVITYDANGGYDAPDTQLKTVGETLVLSDVIPKRTGYRFVGWSTSLNDEVCYMPSSDYNEETDITLYAVWERLYTVMYNANGGTNTPDVQIKTEGKTLVLSGVVPKRERYRFLGWSTSPNGEVCYMPSSCYKEDSDVTLYAVWEPIYIVAYDANGGYGAPASQVQRKGEPLILASAIPYKSECVFLGWATSRDGIVLYGNGATYREESDITLYAQWGNFECLECNGDGVIQEQCKECKGYGTIKEPSVCVKCSGTCKELIAIDNWSPCQVCNGNKPNCANCDGKGKVYTPEYRRVPCSQCDATGVSYDYTKCSICLSEGEVFWQCNQCNNGSTQEIFSVQYYIDREKVFLTQTKYEGVAFVLSYEVPVHLGVQFLGWATSPDGTIEYYPGDTYLENEDLQLYAVWSDPIPSAPTVSSYTDTKVILRPLAGGEYSLDGITWQSSNVFENLSPSTEYTFYQRYAKSDTHEASVASRGTSVTTDKSKQTLIPIAPIIQSITVNSITLVAVDGCEYSKDGITWQSSNVFDELSCGKTYTFYQRYKETSSAYAGRSSESASFRTDKGMQTTPSRPTLSSTTYHSVTLTLVKGYEYSMDGVTWQTSNVFTGLNPETNYLFYQRKAETETHYASGCSDDLIVRTDVAPGCMLDPLLHKYDNTCDTDCNVCGFERTIEHTYSNACDTTCNICEDTRTIVHNYKTTTTKATLSKNGSIVKKCAVCGKVASKSTIYYAKSFSLSTTAYTYTGGKKTPSVTVKDSKGKKLVNGTDYKLTYSSSTRKSIGRYSVKITFIGNYTGSKTLYFTIGPKNPTSVKATLYGHDDVKVTWSKVSGASGYKVYYKKSTSSTWSSKTTTGTSMKLANLADGVKYDIKVVTYKTIGGYKCYNAGKSTSIYTLKKITGVKAQKSGTKVKISWTNISGETGYQISQSTKKSGTNIVSTYKTTSGKYKTVSATKGKTYYYKVRAYKLVNGKKIYSPWSTVVKYVRK